MPTPRSPYEAAAGVDLDALHPVLRRYFAAIPAGHHGYGVGTFDVVGTQRRWLRALLHAVVPHDVIFAVWARDVPFTVVNRQTVDAGGRIAVEATRRFHFTTGDRTMVDAITAEAGGLVDHLGAGRRISVALAARVADGALVLHSTAVSLRLGRIRWRVPQIVAPRVGLSERYDDATEAQRVAVMIDIPLLGRVYEYAGSFRYEIRPGEGPL